MLYPFSCALAIQRELSQQWNMAVPAQPNLGLGQCVPESHSGAACGQLNTAHTDVSTAPVRPDHRVFTVKCKVKKGAALQWGPGQLSSVVNTARAGLLSMLLMGLGASFIQIPSWRTEGKKKSHKHS